MRYKWTMQPKIHISTWLGHAESRAALDRVLSVKYSDEGEFLGSEFSRAFRLGRFDDDFREASRSEIAPKSLEALLAGVSYEAEAIPAIVKTGAELKSGDNCFVCLYGFKAPKGTRASWTFPGLALRFAGVGSFKPEIPESKW